MQLLLPKEVITECEFPFFAKNGESQFAYCAEIRANNDMASVYSTSEMPHMRRKNASYEARKKELRANRP
jgi:hypothetical protein